MKLIQYTALVAMFTAAACAQSDGSSDAVGAAFGLGIDDDGSTKAADPLFIWASMTPPADPWNGAMVKSDDNLIVGPDDLRDINCFSQSTGIPFNAVASVEFKTFDGRICTGTHVTKDGWFVVPDACRAPGPGRFGTITALKQAAVCNGSTTAPTATFAIDAEEYDDNGSGLFLAHATPNPFQAGLFLAKLGVVQPLASASDELLAIGQTDRGNQADPDCDVASWSPGPGGNRGRSDCDTRDPVGIGGQAYWDFNGCVFAPAGGCLPGTGPTAPGALPGRLAALYVGPTSDGLANAVVPLAAITGPGGLLTPHLTPGNFDK